MKQDLVITGILGPARPRMDPREAIMRFPKQTLALVRLISIVFRTRQGESNAYSAPQSTAQPDLNPRTANSRTVTAARSTRCVVTGRTRCPGSGSLHPPAQIVEPDRWLQQNSTQEGGQLATEVNK